MRTFSYVFGWFLTNLFKGLVYCTLFLVIAVPFMAMECNKMTFVFAYFLFMLAALG